MSTFGDDLVQSLREALAHAKDYGPAIVHPAISPPSQDDQPHPNTHGDPLASEPPQRPQVEQSTGRDSGHMEGETPSRQRFVASTRGADSACGRSARVRPCIAIESGAEEIRQQPK